MRAAAAFSPDDVVVGRNSRMRAIFEFLKVVSGSDSNVTVIGESGTGKEVIARMLHHQSPRCHQPFVAVSCALFSETLIESELFGHERGAFTGAHREKPGRFEVAQGGTLFLDDLDDVPLAIQVKLLRVLQNREVERVGATRPIPIDVRIVAGSKRDMKELVAEGRFREDLYFRLNVLPIVLPPLRERREDVPVLMDYFLERFAADRGTAVPSISPVLREAFSRYAWPGNVRELENACERMIQTCTCGTLRVGCMSASILFAVPSGPAPTPAPAADEAPRAVSLDDRLREMERNLIRWALDTTSGNKSRAAALLNIKRSTLGDRIVRCGLTVDSRPADGSME
jgi:transcriptional regulator with PAS, ATPase and Fis domain